MYAFERRVLGAAFPDRESDLRRTTCVSLARGNGKSTLMGVLAAASVVPGAPLHAAGRENYLVAGSLRQGRIVFNAARDVVLIRHDSSSTIYRFDLRGATVSGNTAELSVSSTTRGAILAKAQSDPDFTILVVDDTVTGVDVSNFTYAPDYEELAVTDIISVTVNGVEQELGGSADTWSFSRPRQSIITVGIAPPATATAVASFKANWVARASSGQTPIVQRFVTHAGVASATSGAEIAAGYVNRHRYPTTTIIATIAPESRIHLEIGDGVTIDATDLERLKVPDPASGELWRADLIEISVDGAYLIYSGRFSRRADESRYRELWTQVLKATEDR